ncbi:protein c-Fos-like [Genypterus blacodes]|uniref:protein c-Fos-like n=1 Tax=Genypterus blacodes TaxID=154954 RepID=UPI003F769D13
MHPDSSIEFDSSSSSCSTASPGGDTPGCSQHPPDSLSSSEDITEDTETSAADSFVPTVTAVSSSPDLRWMVQPTVITSSSRDKTPTHGAIQSSSPARASKVQPSSRKGQKEPSREEEERRRIRRERNKIAAAKCRNRRRDLIDTLQAETDQLEEERAALQAEIADLLKEKEKLEQVFTSHKPSCKVPSDDEEEKDSEDDVDKMLQDPPSSPQLLSILENAKPPESNTAMVESSSVQDMDSIPCIPAAAAILGNSNILLCSSAEEEEALRDLRGDDLDDLVPSLEMAVMAETEASVPDIDLSGPFCLSDWDTLYNSVANDLEPLSTPLMSSSPTCSNRTVFSFNYSEIDALAEGYEGLKGSVGSSEFKDNSLNSPTLLAL